MIAMLGMYDLPAIQPANDRYWRAIRKNLGYGPDHLTRNGDVWEVWQSPDLVLAQTCGMPYRTRLHGLVRRIGTPDYGLSDCPPGYYFSFFVARAQDQRANLADFEGAKFAYNDPLSQSGWAAPVLSAASQSVRFAAHVESGGHANSARFVAKEHADIAGIDAVTWQFLKEHDPITKDLKVIGRTDPTPGLPYITAAKNDPAMIAQAVHNAIADLSPKDRDTLHLHGLVDIPDSAYLAVPSPAAPNMIQDVSG